MSRLYWLIILVFFIFITTYYLVLHYFYVMEYLIFLVIALIVAIGGLFLFKKCNILDKPWSDLKNTRKPVPTLQWIFVILAFMLWVGVVFPSYYSSPLFLWLLIPWLLIWVVELIEELSYLWKFPKVPPILRLCVHLIAAFLAVWIWGIWNQELVIWDSVYAIPNWLFAIAFMIWTMFCINAINWFDWIYAQWSWVSAIGFLTIYLLIKFVVFKSYDSFTNYEVLVMVQNLSLFLFIISLIYTFIEYKPLGLVRDVGIMFFGFSIAYLSVAWGAKIWTLVVALSLAIFDAIWVGLYRIFILKKNPLNWDYTHFHHRLMWLWFTRWETRAFIWIWSVMMMILMLLQWSNRFSKIVIFVMMACLFFWINGYLFLYKKLPCWLQIKKER
jgi:UDP-N-acetylmuramyl pentapeptide phosphotransferase/UDP-N-acetylglucosamine-1-phosphate transferase